MHERDQTTDVAEAQRGQQTRAHHSGARDATRLAPAAGQADGRARPDPEGVPLQRRIDHVKARVAGSHPSGQDLCQTRDLEQRGTSFGVTGDRLLRDGHQRIALRSSQRARQAGVQFGLVGIIGARRRVVLGDHGDVVRFDAQGPERARQAGILSAAAGRQGAQTGCRDGGVGAVGVGGDEADHSRHRQPQASGHAGAGQDHSTAALGLYEAAATTVVGAREVAGRNALGVHGSGLGGGIHIAETDDGLHRDVVDGAGDDHIRLAQCDLVPALLDGHRRGGAGADRLDHGPVTADVGLHDVSGHHVGQRLLEDVAGTVLAEQTSHEHLAHRLHAAEAGALRGGHVRRVDGREQLGRRESRRQEGVDRRDQIPRRDRVHALDHGRRDPPALRVEVDRELTADRARQGRAARDAHQRAR